MTKPKKPKKITSLGPTPLDFVTNLGVPPKNKHFHLVFCDSEGTYDLVLQQDSYSVDPVFLDMLGLIHLIAQNCPGHVLRIGAKLESNPVPVKPVIETGKPKLILN